MQSARPSLTRYALPLAAAALVSAAPAHSQQEPPIPPAVAGMARAIAAELLMQCPLADADDQAAFESCRGAIGADGVLASFLPDSVLWGRQRAGSPQPQGMTQLAPQLWTQLYAPLFMFNGNHEVQWVAQEQQFVIRLQAAFRNRLAAGQFPAPFWQDGAEWGAYQRANAVLLWVQPRTGRIHLAQFTDQAATPLLQPVVPVARNEATWPGDAGSAQPAVAQLDGLYRADNPFLRALDRQYRDLALSLREAQCTGCHATTQPRPTGPLVLLTTPAHAAGEIDRLIRAVREDRMPVAADGQARPLPAEDKQWLLRSAEAFRDTVRAARRWEAEAERRERAVAWQPAVRGPQDALAPAPLQR